MTVSFGPAFRLTRLLRALQAASDLLDSCEWSLFLRFVPSLPAPLPPNPPLRASGGLPAPKLTMHGALPPLHLHASVASIDAALALISYAQDMAASLKSYAAEVHSPVAAATSAAAAAAAEEEARVVELDPPSSPKRPLRVELRLQLPHVALHLHASPQPLGTHRAADLLMVRALGLDVRAVGSSEGTDFSICATEIAVRDARPFVPPERAPLLQLDGATPRPLPQGIQASLGTALGGSSGAPCAARFLRC